MWEEKRLCVRFFACFSLYDGLRRDAQFFFVSCFVTFFFSLLSNFYLNLWENGGAFIRILLCSRQKASNLMSWESVCMEFPQDVSGFCVCSSWQMSCCRLKNKRNYSSKVIEIRRAWSQSEDCGFESKC